MKGTADLSFLLRIFLVYSVSQINSRTVSQAELTAFSHIFPISPFIVLSSCLTTFAITYAAETCKTKKEWIWDIHVFIIFCALVLVKIHGFRRRLCFSHQEKV